MGFVAPCTSLPSRSRESVVRVGVIPSPGRRKGYGPSRLAHRDLRKRFCGTDATLAKGHPNFGFGTGPVGAVYCCLHQDGGWNQRGFRRVPGLGTMLCMCGCGLDAVR